MRIVLVKSIFTFALIFGAQCVFAEDGTLISEGVQISFGSFSAFVLSIPVVMEAIKSTGIFTPHIPKIVIQIVSWVLGLIMAAIAWKLELGIFAGITIQKALLYGFGGSLMSNGVANTKVVKLLFSIFKSKSVKG